MESSTNQWKSSTNQKHTHLGNVPKTLTSQKKYNDKLGDWYFVQVGILPPPHPPLFGTFPSLVYFATLQSTSYMVEF